MENVKKTSCDIFEEINTFSTKSKVVGVNIAIRQETNCCWKKK